MDQYVKCQKDEMASVWKILRRYDHIEQNKQQLVQFLQGVVFEIEIDIKNAAFKKFYEIYPGEGDFTWNCKEFTITYGTLFSNLKLHIDPLSTVGSKYLQGILLRYIVHKYKTKHYTNEVNKVVANMLLNTPYQHERQVADDVLNHIKNKIVGYIIPYSSSDINICGISTLKPQEMCCNLTELIGKIINHEEDKVEERYSELYVCPKCHARKSTHKKIQIRSLDEGESLKLTCKACEHTWTII